MLGRFSLVGRLYELLVVCQASGQHAGKDEVERRGPRPILFDVVDLERAVRRNPVAA